MKKIPTVSKIVALVLGLCGGALYGVVLSVGTDEAGLYPANHPCWIGYLVVCALAVPILLCLTHGVGTCADAPKNGTARRIVRVFAALALLFSSVSELSADNSIFDTLVCLLGAVAALAMMPWERFLPTSKYRRELSYALPCAYFVIRMFCLILRFRGEPELLRFLPQVLAMPAAAIACYHLWGRTVGLDSEKKRLFWQCLGATLCLACACAAPWTYPLGIWLLAEPSDPVVPRVSVQEPTEEAPEEVSEPRPDDAQ